MADENLNKILNDNIDVSFNFNLSLTNVLEQCRNDKTIYTILQLDQAFDLTSEIENWQENFGIDKIIEDIKKQVDETLDDITNNIDISTFETQVDELSEILSEMIGYINDEIIKLNVKIVKNYIIFRCNIPQCVCSIFNNCFAPMESLCFFFSSESVKMKC